MTNENEVLSAKIGYNDLVKCIQAFDYSEEVSVAIADYLTECIDYEMDLTYYIWNTLLFNVEVLDSKEEALQYIEDNLCVGVEDCKIYETCNNKCYLQW